MGLKITKGRVSIVLAFLTDQKSTQIRRLNADLPISVDLTAVKLVAPLPNIVFFLLLFLFVRYHGLETDAASLTEGSPPLPMADWTVKTDMLGEDGPSATLDGGIRGLRFLE